jgi:hypothetical protein
MPSGMLASWEAGNMARQQFPTQELARNFYVELLIKNVSIER